MPGGRGRIGLIVPSNNAAIEYDFWKMLPDGVTVHSTRMRPTKGCEPEDVELFTRELREVSRLLQEVSDVIVYGRTYGTHKHASVIRQTIPNVILPGEAVIEVLKKLNARKIWIGTPYIKERTLEEVQWMKSQGFDVIGFDGLNKIKGVDISNTPVFTIYRLVKRNLEKVVEADAIYLACTALSTFEVSNYLTEDLGIPVVSENAAAMWRALRTLRIIHKVPGFEI
ncbi:MULTISPECIES: arylmalonate decarboxylase [Acidianus]|uniref:Arylmalonate decarboxylase n=1 Tax=Candidatus Acidianus copahuensis TaxID=1160895 RepID=A0A031LRQ7_9CREN|nr:MULTISPECIES: arylmalonate decarboxylase [Acidianus]EZQ11052.1 arylmalonate decarboxylase [Candidatus Acidianus copahuensis]NON62131.1 arylmalonate decarboxylase [Acidianus sp. RZ1]